MKTRKLILAFVILSIGLSFSTINLFAQEENKPQTEITASSCENIRYFIDSAIVENSKIEVANLILIFRLGRGELSTKLNKLRMAEFEKAFKYRQFNQKYILAEGQRSNNLGKVEIYVGGKLLADLYIKKNKLGSHSCID